MSRGPEASLWGLFPTQENPALTRWVYARTQNVYPTFRPTPKTSFLGLVFGLGPLLFWAAVFKFERVSWQRGMSVNVPV